MTYSKITHKIYSLIHFDSHSNLRGKRRVPPEHVLFSSNYKYYCSTYLKPTQKVVSEKLFQVSSSSIFLDTTGKRCLKGGVAVQISAKTPNFKLNY